MSKRVRRPHRRRSRTSRTGHDHQRPATVLDRILTAPHLEQVVPRLHPEVLHRVIQHCGLEECGPLVALATPGQLTRLFDLDLWRPAAPGLDDQFDADRFGTWLEVMVDTGAASAAATLAAMDVDLVAAGLAQHVRVFDYAAVAPFITLDGELSSGLAVDGSLHCVVAGFSVSATGTTSWDAIIAVLSALADAHGDSFNRVMRACCRLSNSRPEADGFHDLLTTSEQAMFDQALDREARHDAQGYVTPAQARAFLQASRRIDVRHGAMPPRDPMTSAYFRGIDAQTTREQPDPPAEAVAAIVDLLHEAGVMPRTRRALLEGAPASAPRLGRIRAHLQFVHDRDPESSALRNAELLYLANVIAAGSTIQSRSIAADEASNAAVAVCNLGLENWPADRPDDLLIRHDLVSVFQVGWTVLHEDVCMYAADQLISILASIECADAHVHEALEALRVTLLKHWRAGSPWEAREALDVIAMLDTPAWAALLALMDRLPTLHAAAGALLAGTTRQIDATAFEFISENTQLQQVRDFMQLLPRLLR